jgi:hypothetical protein
MGWISAGVCRDHQDGVAPASYVRSRRSSQLQVVCVSVDRLRKVQAMYRTGLKCFN